MATSRYKTTLNLTILHAKKSQIVDGEATLKPAGAEVRNPQSSIAIASTNFEHVNVKVNDCMQLISMMIVTSITWCLGHILCAKNLPGGDYDILFGKLRRQFPLHTRYPSLLGGQGHVGVRNMVKFD